MMRKILPITLLLILTLTLVLSACNAPTAPPPDPALAITQAAQTVGAQFTQQAAARGTATPAPTKTLPPPPTNTAPAEQPTVAATQPPAPGPAPATVPAATAASNTADAGSFVTDVTVPDGTAALPGAVFDKIWRVKNTGTTTWTPAYALVVVDGERMGAPDFIPMPVEVRPGETVDIAVKLTAPTKPGTYQTYFRLRNAGGQFFRLDGSGDLWLKIVVGTGATATSATAQPTDANTPTLTPTP